MVVLYCPLYKGGIAPRMPEDAGQRSADVYVCFIASEFSFEFLRRRIKCPDIIIIITFIKL